MSWIDTLDFMKGRPNEWFSSRDISNILKVTYNVADDSTRILRKHNLVFYKTAMRRVNNTAIKSVINT